MELSPRCHLEMLGGLRLRQGSQVLQRFRTQKTAALLAYLAFHRTRRHPREELIALLWPEADPEAGRASLRSALTALRRQLPSGDDLLQADRRDVGLDAEAVTTDVAVFDWALRAAGHAPEASEERVTLLARALEPYRGPLLPGFYDDWVVRERERLDQRFVGGLRAMAQALERTGAPERAIEYGLRAVAADPLTEANHDLLMRLYAATGQFAAVQRQFRALERLLREELRTTPTEATRSLVATLLQDRNPVVLKDPRTLRQERTLPSPYRPLPAAPVPTPLPPSRLPRSRSSFVGRETELLHLLSLLAPGAARLVTLTGPGGAGKTRLALEAAQRLSGAYGGAVWFAPLADVTAPDRIPEAVLAALSPERTAVPEPFERTVELLSAAPGLLVLDNYEHLADEGAGFVADLLERAPGLACLVTSRHRLDIEGEQELPVPPLPVPELPGTPGRLEEFPGIQLFADRARATRPDFAVTAENAAAVAALCRRLDGIPLGIELAAAWSSTLTPRQILDRLEGRLDLLASDRRDLSPRHRTLRATIAWSHRLLPLPLQRFFAQLSVFQGGWTLEAAEAVCEEPQAAAFLKRLRDRSLLVAEERGEAMRYRMLETLREYASEQLDAPVRHRAEGAHAAYFLRIAEEAAPHLEGSHVRQWLDRLEREHENFRIALTRCRAGGDAATGLRLATALWRFWQARGHWDEGRAHLEDALRPPPAGAPEATRARALYAVASLTGHLGDYPTARVYAEEARALWQALGDTGGYAQSLHLLGNLAMDLGEWEVSVALYEESLALRRALGDRRGVASSLLVLGNTALKQDPALAAQRYQESLEIRRELGDLRGMATALNNLGEAARHHNDWDGARRRYEESLEIAREIGDRLGVSLAIGNLAGAALMQGDLPRARALNVQSLTLRGTMGDRRLLTGALDDVAQLALAEGRIERAAVLCGAATALRRAIRLPVPEDDSTAERVRARLEPRAFAAAWERGLALSLAEALAFALEDG